MGPARPDGGGCAPHTHVHTAGENPLRLALCLHCRQIVVITTVCAFWASGFYVVFVWIATYEATVVDPPVPEAYAINTAMLFGSSLVLFPLFGTFGARVPRGGESAT